MITLPKLLISDTELPASGQATTGGESAQDFLALLTGALSANPAKGGKLTLDDLRNVTRQLPQSDAKTSLNDLLAKQAQETDAPLDLTTLTAAQPLLNTLAPQLKNELGQLLNQNSRPESDDEENPLAGLSALMAMLPPQAPAAPAVSAKGDSALTAAAGSVNATPAGLTSHGDLNAALPHAAGAKAHASAGDNASATPVLSPAAAKIDADSTPSPTAVINATPTISATTSNVVTHPVVTVNSQLGTPEWQQNVSQHITLFTRQGQQTAELRLHPQDLGQVHITLKLDDNQAQLQMVSPHGHVRAALEAALPVLRTQLADNGIQLAQSNISSDNPASQQQQSAWQQQQNSQRSAEGQAFGADDEESLIVPAALQSAARGTGAVDTFA